MWNIAYSLHLHTLCGTQSFANTQYIRLWQPRFIGLHRTLAALIVLHCIACALRWTQNTCFGKVSWCWFVLSFITTKCWILPILVLEIRCIKWLNGINFCVISTACERIYLYYIDYYYYRIKTKKSLPQAFVLLLNDYVCWMLSSELEDWQLILMPCFIVYEKTNDGVFWQAVGWNIISEK